MSRVYEIGPLVCLGVVLIAALVLAGRGGKAPGRPAPEVICGAFPQSRQHPLQWFVWRRDGRLLASGICR